jgi:PTS system nitrogen regulatory IIA component
MANVVRPDTLVPRLFATTKQQAIDELLAALAKAGLVTNADAARESVWTRERSMSTGLEHGVAIPHGRTDAVSALVCAIGLAPDGIEFESADGQPAHIIVLTLSPSTAPAPHVQFIARISQVLNPEGRMLLMTCHTPAEMAAVLTGGASDRAGSVLGDLRHRLAPHARTSSSLVAQFVRPEVVIPRLHAKTPDEAINEMLDLAKAKKLLRSDSAARAAVLGHEHQFHTGLSHGIAIPHARTDSVDHLFCIVGRSPNGIDFGAPDGELTRIVILMVSPLSAGEPQVRLMAQISRALDGAGRTRVLAADTAEDIAAALTGTVPA